MKKFLLGFFITILIIVILVVVAAVIVINLTPRQLHLEQISLGEKTVEELGLADTKIIDIYKGIKSIGNTKEEDVVDNPVNQEEEKANAEDNFEGSTLGNTDDYSSVAIEPVVYVVPKLIEYDDTTIAYILDNIVQHADADSSEEIKALKDANLSVKELSITKDGSTGKMRVVSYMDLSNYQDDIKNALGAAASVLPIPKQAYLVSEFTFTVNSLTGKMETTPVSISVNGNSDDPVSRAILEVMGSMADGEDVDSLNGKLGEAIARVVGNLGRIGSSLLPPYGMNGVADHKLTLVTY
ncbi:MAG: hypothetical protein IK048_04395 [Clostridia bacterium]|nr:hypothetical protein [Clostridia bacterium]